MFSEGFFAAMPSFTRAKLKSNPLTARVTTTHFGDSVLQSTDLAHRGNGYLLQLKYYLS